MKYNVKVGGYCRIKYGIYANDLGKIATVNENNIVKVFLVPRPDLKEFEK